MFIKKRLLKDVSEMTNDERIILKKEIAELIELPRLRLDSCEFEEDGLISERLADKLSIRAKAYEEARIKDNEVVFDSFLGKLKYQIKTECIRIADVGGFKLDGMYKIGDFIEDEHARLVFLQRTKVVDTITNWCRSEGLKNIKIDISDSDIAVSFEW